MGFLIKKFLIFAAILSYRLFGKCPFYAKLRRRFLSPIQNEYLEKLIRKDYLHRHAVRKAEVKSGKTVYFDVSVYMFSLKISGISRVVSKFIEYLPEIAKENGYDFKTVADIRGYGEVSLDAGEWRVVSGISPGKGDVFLCVDLSAFEVLNNRKSIEKWKKNGCVFIASVYDLCFVKYPEYVHFANSASVLEKWLSYITSAADGIITDSRTVMEEVRDWAESRRNANPDLKYGYFYLGSDFKRRNIKTEHSAFTFIAVSTIEPRKGYKDLIRAYEKSPVSKERSRLIIAGRLGWKCEDIIREMESSPLYNEKIFWYGDASDEELEALYAESDVYVSASYYEGFGLGVVEGTSYNLPLIVRDIPVYREIVGENGMYFTDTETLASCMKACYNFGCVENKMKYLNWRESAEMAFEAVRGMGLLC